MDAVAKLAVGANRSVATGPPLSSEPGLGPLTLPGFLREVTGRYADREALVLRTGSGAETVRESWTYADLWERSLEVAKALRAVGVGRDSRVGVLMTNRPEWLSAVFGTALAGGVAVTLSTFSTPTELEHLVRVSGVAVLLFEHEVGRRDFAAVLGDLDPAIGGSEPGELQSVAFPFLRRLAVVGGGAGGAIEDWAGFLAHGASQPEEPILAIGQSTKPSDTAVLFFSSGSTSLPKGILSANRGVSIQLWRFARMYALSPDDDVRCWTANGFFWSGNFGMALGGTLATGGSLVLQRTFDPAEALELIQAERVSFPVAWPHQWPQLEAVPGWTEADFSNMRFADRGFAFARHPSVKVRDYTEPGHAYGNTETFTLTTCFPSGTPDDVIAGSSGVPLPGNTVKIIDPLTADVVPLGERGEICVKGPTLMLGYLGTPLDETLDPEGFFRTGDAGHLDETGRLFWHGRLTDIIKTGGANVSPREVDEAVLALPGVKATQTVGVPHETFGEVVVSCVVPHTGITLDADALRTSLRERLASYKVPRHILFFAETDLELTGSNKIKSSEVRDLATKRLAHLS